MGPYQLQIFSSLVVIVAAAIVALLCDFLKRDNDQLRELAIELKVRYEQEHKRPRNPAPRPAQRTPAPNLTAVKQRSITTVENKQTASKPVLARRDWGSLLSNAAPAPKIEPAETRLPAGFQERQVLNKLVESRVPVSGLVVSVSVGASSSAAALPESVIRLVHSLIGPEDFAACSGDNEFVLLYPKERSEAARRRLGLVAQQLWDFQLGSLGALQIQFRWGGLEVSGEPIDNAIASATERMQETKRERKSVL